MKRVQLFSRPRVIRGRLRAPVSIAVASLALCMGLFMNHAAAATDTGGVLKIAMSAGNIPLPDVAPDQGYEGYRFVGNNIYDGLTKLNLDQTKTLPTPQPALATSWSVSPDKLTWTFDLRRGVTFQDGTPFNAGAVIFNWERDHVTTSKYYDAVDAARLSSYFQEFKSFKEDNEYQVSVTTTTPYGFLPYDLLTIYYASPTAVEKWGNANYLNHATGTGPFIMTKYENNVEMILKPNKHYWDGPPKLDELILYPEPEDASRLASLQSGAVNWAEVPSPDALSELKGQGYQIFMENNHPGAIMPEFNEFRAPFKNNIKLREALNYALNRQATIAVINGTGIAASQYVQPGSPYYVPGVAGFSYNLAKAKQLLSEAGYGPGKKPLHLQMAYPPNGSGNMFPEPMVEEMQADFKAIGVTMTLTPIEWDTFTTIRTSGGLDASQWSKYDIIWSSPAAGMLPTGFETSFLCSIAGVPNDFGYCDPTADKYFDEAEQSFSVSQQDAYLRDMSRVALSDVPFLYWVTDRNLRVMSPDVHGYIPAQSWWVDFTKVWVS
jgi:peptide/nickel transport system substrate-binding protein